MIHSKVEAVLEVRKVFGSSCKLDVCARSAAARERSAYNRYTWTKSGDKLVKTFKKPARKVAIVQHDVKLFDKVFAGGDEEANEAKVVKEVGGQGDLEATCKIYEPVNQRKRPIFSGVWEAKKPIESVPEVRHDSDQEVKSKVTAEVKPAAGDEKEVIIDSPVREVGSSVIVNVRPVQSTVARKEVKETDEPGKAKVKLSANTEKWLRIARERIAGKAKDVLEDVDVVRDEVGTTEVEGFDRNVKCPKSNVESPVKVTIQKPENFSKALGNGTKLYWEWLVRKKEAEVQPSRNVASKIKTVLETVDKVLSVLLRILVWLLVAGLLGSVVMGLEEWFVTSTSNGGYCEFVDWAECTQRPCFEEE